MCACPSFRFYTQLLVRVHTYMTEPWLTHAAPYLVHSYRFVTCCLRMVCPMADHCWGVVGCLVIKIRKLEHRMCVGQHEVAHSWARLCIGAARTITFVQDMRHVLAI